MTRVLRKLLQLLTKKQKRQSIVLALIMLFGGIMESLSVSLIMPLVTAIMNEHTWSETWYAKIICGITRVSNHRSYIIVLLIGLIIIFLLKNTYLAWEYYIQYSFATKCKYNMQYKLLSDYLHKPYVFFLSSNTGEIIRIINGDTVQAFSVLENMLIFFTEAIVCIALGITIFFMSPSISMGIILVLLFEILLIAKIIRPIMTRFGETQRKESAIAYQWMIQALDGIKTVRVSRNEDYFLNKYATHFSKANDIDRIYNTLKNLPRLIIEAFTICSVLGAMLVMIIHGVEMSSLIPILSAFVLAAMRLLPSTNRISMVINQLPFLEGGLDNILNISKGLSNKNLIENRKIESINNTTISFESEIKLDKVTFSYPDSNKKILNEVTLSIKPNQSIGFIGSSGGGKTTTVDVLLGLLKPVSGHVLVDEKDINMNHNAWLSHVAYIPQQIFLIDASIKENIALGIEKNKIDENKVNEVIKEAQLEELIESLPDRLETTVGEQGVRLSGGQRQRIGIARALYANADVLFFDEATSALDTETEKAVMESIENLKEKKTMIIIAHRLSTLKNCDHVYRVENGRIIEEKNFEI